MASEKKRRKAAKAAKKKPQTGPFRHPDGDRRRREAMRAARKAVEARERMRKLYGVVEQDG
jgi:hypothetical protein